MGRINRLNLEFSSSAMEANRLPRAIKACTAQRSLDPKVQNRLREVLNKVRVFHAQKFGSEGELTRSLTGITRAVENGNMPSSFVESQMERVSSDLFEAQKTLQNLSQEVEPDCQDNTSECIYDAQDKFIANGQRSPVRLATDDMNCFVYRVGDRSPANFTPSLRDLDESLLTRLIVMPNWWINPISHEYFSELSDEYTLKMGKTVFQSLTRQQAQDILK